MATSRKSCSLAAALLVVAVLAGTCAPGAHAQLPSVLTVTNNCTTNVAINIGLRFFIPPNISLSVPPRTNVTLPVPLSGFLFKFIQFILNGTVFTVPNGNIIGVTGLFGVITGISISCNATGTPCVAGSNVVTLTAAVPPSANLVKASVCL